MLKIDISNDAGRFIESRIPKHQRQILNKIISLSCDPWPPDSKLVKTAEKGRRRATAGEYRIIYHVQPSHDPEILHVDAVGKRNDDEVYRRFDKH